MLETNYSYNIRVWAVCLHHGTAVLKGLGSPHFHVRSNFYRLFSSGCLVHSVLNSRHELVPGTDKKIWEKRCSSQLSTLENKNESQLYKVLRKRNAEEHQDNTEKHTHPRQIFFWSYSFLREIYIYRYCIWLYVWIKVITIFSRNKWDEQKS